MTDSRLPFVGFGSSPPQGWRSILAALVLVLGGATFQAFCATDLSPNEYGWRRLPTDAEIDRAANDQLTYLSAKVGNGDRFSYRNISDVRIVKMHKPAVNRARDEVDASMAWLLFTTTFVEVYPGGERRQEPQHFAQWLMFEENRQKIGNVPITTKGWYFSGGIQRDSLEERNRYVQGWFEGFHFLPGFGWEREPSTGPSSPESGNWMTAVGAGAAGAAAVAAAAKVIASIFNRGSGRKKNTKDQKNDADEAIGYVLQVSTEEVDLSSGVPQSLTVTAWAVDTKGGYRPAPRASIEITPSGTASSAVNVNPSSGVGTLNCKIGMGQGGGFSAGGDAALEVTVSAPGGGSGNARVRLTCAAQPVMEFF